MRHEFTLSINLNAHNYHTEPNIILIYLKKKDKFSKRRKNKFGNSDRITNSCRKVTKEKELIQKEMMKI